MIEYTSGQGHESDGDAMTRSSQSPKHLRPRQQRAIDLLALGQTDAEVAERVGATRITVAEWRLYDPVFVAALNHKREEARSASPRESRVAEHPSDASPLPCASGSIGESAAPCGVSEGGVGAR